MFLELAEVLDCPTCREGYGLVAFMERAHERRVLKGRLGCPLCETEFSVFGGEMQFATPETVVENQRVEAPHVADQTSRGDPPEDTAAAAMRLAALMGLSGNGLQIALVGPEYAHLALRVARIGGGAEIIVWCEGETGVEGPAPGVNAMRGSDPTAWPVRSGSLNAIALGGSLAGCPGEVARCARQGARLVAGDLTEREIKQIIDAGFAELANEPGVWVGQRC